MEKLGRNDLCPCGSGRRFQTLLPSRQTLRWNNAQGLLPLKQPSRILA
ncbi:MAG: SEC-C metal-binding domain-containing protein [Roseiarcus sp.]